MTAIDKYEKSVKNSITVLAGNMIHPSVFKDGSEFVLSNLASLRWKNLLIIHEESSHI